jgi:hypothetical protein
MKKMILSGIFVAAIALTAWNFYSTSRSEDLNDLAKANIEALAKKEDQPKEPGSVKDGNNGYDAVSGYCTVCGADLRVCVWCSEPGNSCSCNGTIHSH